MKRLFNLFFASLILFGFQAHAQVKIYGVNYQNGANNLGTIYSVNPDGSSFTKLHDFDGTNGSNPLGQLTKLANGKIAGITDTGGTFGKGVIYSVKTDGTSYGVLYNFYNAVKSYGLFTASNGKLYTIDGPNLITLNSDGTLPATNPQCFSDAYDHPTQTTFTLSQSNPDPSSIHVFFNNVDNNAFNYDNTTNIVDFWGLYPGSGNVRIDFCTCNGCTSPSINATSASYFSPMIELPTGELVASAAGAGANGLGYLFKINKDGTGFTSLYDFQLNGGANPTSILKASDGKLYITCQNGGNLNAGYSGGYGSIMSFNADGSSPTPVFEWTDDGIPNGFIGKQPYWGVTEGSDGLLYGATSFHNGWSQGNAPSGLVFKVKKDGTGYTPLYLFNTSGTTGATPLGGVVQLTDGSIISTTYSGGISPGGGGIFKINSDGTGFLPLKYFDTNSGTNPSHTTPLLVYTGMKKAQTMTFNLQTTATYGAASIPLTATATSGMPVLYTSSNPAIVTIDSNKLKIKAVGKVSITAKQSGNYEYNAAMSVVRTITIAKANQTITFNALPAHNVGEQPFALSASASSGLPVTLTSSNTAVATVAGNTLTITGSGTATITATQPGNTAYNAALSVPQTLTVNGFNGYRLMLANQVGGANGQGTILSVSADGSNPITNIDLLVGITGSDPERANFTQASDGNLYGVMGNGGANSVGTIVKIKLDGTGFTKLFDFGDGRNPYGKLIQATNGYLYGTTYQGGANGVGTIYKIKTDGTGYTKLHDFDGSNGADPLAGLIQATNGYLYGTTYAGGGYGQGVIYRIMPDGTGFTKITDVSGYLYGGVVQASNGDLYGTARMGPSGNGYVYRIKLDGSGWGYVNFTGSNGAQPVGAELVQATNGDLYGVTSLGGNSGGGVIFKIKTDLTGFTKLLDFDSNSGTNPYSGVTEDKNGSLYGALNGGGIYGGGVIYKIQPDGTGFTKILDLNSSNGTHPFAGVTIVQSQFGPTSNVYVTLPADAAIGVNVTVSVKALAVKTATSYSLELNSKPNFTGTSTLFTAATPSFAVTGLTYNTTYYTRVKTDLSPDWGKSTMFTTGTSESFAYVKTPANNATAQQVSLSLMLNAVIGATNYTVELNTDSNFGAGTALAQNGTKTTYAYANLQFNTPYYTRVMTNLSPNWGPVKTFTTGTAESLSYITSPMNGAVNVPFTTNVTCNAISNVTSYTIELNTDGVNFDPATAIVKSLGSKTIGFALAYDTKYFARVSVDEGTTWGTNIKSFTTGNPLSLAFVTSPKNNSSGVPSTVNVSSNMVPGATSYTIELNTLSDFSGTPFTKTGISKTQSFTGLAVNTIYYTRVQTNVMSGKWGTTTTSFTTSVTGARSSDWEGEVSDDEVVVFEPNSVNTYPVPFSDRLRVHVQAETQDAMQVQFYDLSGKEISRRDGITNSILEFETIELSSGMYIVKLVTNRGIIAKRVIKQ